MSDPSNSRYYLLAFAGLALGVALLVAPIGLGPTQFARAVENALHGPLFALAAIGVLLFVRAVHSSISVMRPYLLAFVGAVALGGFGELAQMSANTRHAEWGDLFNDALGALVGLCWYARRDPLLPLGSSTRLFLLSVAIAASVALIAPVARSGQYYWQRKAQLPELATWGSSTGRHLIFGAGGEIVTAAVPPQWSSSQNEMALSVTPKSTGAPDDRWVGVTIEEPWPNWRSYSRLAVEIVNPNEVALRFTLRVNDREHNNDYDDRFNRELTIPARQRATVSFALPEIQSAPATRRMDMEAISRIVLFQDADQGARSFYLRRIYLIP